MKNPESDWLRTFWSIFLEQKFSQILHLHRIITNNIDFHYRTNVVKMNDQIFQVIQSPIFGTFLVHFPNFGGKKILFWKMWPLAQLHMGF